MSKLVDPKAQIRIFIWDLDMNLESFDDCESFSLTDGCLVVNYINEEGDKVIVVRTMSNILGYDAVIPQPTIH